LVESQYGSAETPLTINVLVLSQVRKNIKAKPLRHPMNNDFSSAAMSFFNPNVPLLCPKQNVQELPDSPGLWRCCWQVGDITLVSTFYTPLDQVCLVWGVISLVIFTTAQFLPISWLDQAVWWSILTLIGTVGMVVLTPSWLKGAELGWVVYSWVFLMLLGVVITDLAIFLSWGDVLTSLCQLWLGLVGLGYLFTGLGMRSRTLILTSLVHLLGIAALPYMSTMQFLVTGVIMGGSSLLLAVFQWDSFGACGGQIESHQLNGVV
jgi:hypothetical protein